MSLHYVFYSSTQTQAHKVKGAYFLMYYVFYNGGVWQILTSAAYLIIIYKHFELQLDHNFLLAGLFFLKGQLFLSIHYSLV